MESETGVGEKPVLSKRQRRELAKKNRSDATPAEPVQGPYRSATPANNDTIVTRYDVEKTHTGGVRLSGYDQHLGRLEHLQSRGVITERQLDGGSWLAEQWAGYFLHSKGSGIDQHAPGSIPADPLNRWTKGQRTTTPQGKPRTPPPTFRPRKPSDGRRGHDGWTYSRCEALQDWRRANSLLHCLSDYERIVVMLVAVEGLSLQQVSQRITGSTRAPGGKQLEVVKRALRSGLDYLADETQPQIQELAA